MADEPDISALIGGDGDGPSLAAQIAAAKAAGLTRKPTPAPAPLPASDERRRIHLEAALASIRPDHLLKPARSATDAWELADAFMTHYDRRYPK